MNPLELFANARQGALSFLEGQQAPARKKFSEVLIFEKALAWGSCVPLVSQLLGTTRVLYGVALFSYASAELINKIAQANLGRHASLANHLALMKGGVAPVFIRAFEHITLGICSASTLWGNIGCIFFETVVRPSLSTVFDQEVTVDPEAITKLSSRIKKHSLCVKLDKAIQELKRLAFSS